jgi:hypothetical protein
LTFLVVGRTFFGMEPDLRDHDERRRRDSRIWLLFCLGAIPCLLLAKGSFNLRRPVTISLDTNGVPSLAGLALRNASVRHGVFTTMHLLHISVQLTLPEIGLKNPPPSSIVSMIGELNQAGLLAPVQRMDNSAASPFNSPP